MRKIILALTVLLMFCGVSYADFIYTTSTGSLGTITINSSSDIEESPNQYAGKLSSPFLTTYWNGSTTRLALIDRNATASGDRAYIFTPDSLANYSASWDIAGVYDTEEAGYSENGYSLFLTSGAWIYEIRTADFRVLNSYDCTRILSNDSYSTEIVSINVDSSLINVIVAAGDARRYAQFDGQLDDTRDYFKSRDVSSGASSVLSTSDNYNAIGHSSGIDVINRRNVNFYAIASTDYPVKAMCLDNSGSLFYATQYQSGDEYVNTIMHLADGTSFSPVTIESSFSNIKLVRDDSKRETFAAMTNEGISIITYKDKLTSTHEFTASMLGGTPVGIVSATVSGYNGNSSSSGCDASGLGLMMLAAVLVMRRK